ncbi:MAG: phosphoribosylglycinamide formyltransferase [Bacteroidales bacterium]|nr:phosphoribosylglycinamide formyltransferase [Bacteroidales bacterium]
MYLIFQLTFAAMKRLAIFVSGSGTNMERIGQHFSRHTEIEVALVVCSNPKAVALQRAKTLGIEAVVIDKSDLREGGKLLKLLQEKQIDWLILAGFLWLVPTELVGAYTNRILNIHPALLPAYSGKGMYGEKVHQAVIQNREKQSGITIHYVNNNYDEGNIVFQQSLDIAADETPESLAQRIHQLEYKHYPEVIESLVLEGD